MQIIVLMTKYKIRDLSQIFNIGSDFFIRGTSLGRSMDLVPKTLRGTMCEPKLHVSCDHIMLTSKLSRLKETLHWLVVLPGNDANNASG